MKDEDAAAVLTFLRETLSTDRLDEPRLLALAAAVRAERSPAGVTILNQGGEPAIYLYVIRSGHVEIRVDGQLVDLPGGTGEATAPTPGTYDFVCTIHPSMTGTIIVT